MFKCWTMLINNNGVKLFIEKLQVRVNISGQDILSIACFNAVRPPVQALFEREYLMFWVLVCSKVLLVLQRRNVHSLRLCRKFVPRNVGPLVVGGGLCAQQ